MSFYGKEKVWSTRLNETSQVMASDGWAYGRSITAPQARLSETACYQRLTESGLFAGQRVGQGPDSVRRDNVPSSGLRERCGLGCPVTSNFPFCQ